LLVTVNNRLKFEIEIVHDLSCHPIIAESITVESAGLSTWQLESWVETRCNIPKRLMIVKEDWVGGQATVTIDKKHVLLNSCGDTTETQTAPEHDS